LQQQGSFALDEKSFIKGTHIVTIFHNESNLYSVVRIRVEETNEAYDEQEVVVTGYFPRMHDHDTYVFYGSFKEHPKFGRQYVVEYFRKDVPHTKEGIIHYLSSDLFKGIGKKTDDAFFRVRNVFAEIFDDVLPPEFWMLFKRAVEHIRIMIVHAREISSYNNFLFIVRFVRFFDANADNGIQVAFIMKNRDDMRSFYK
jgi:ATP-dependent exoDNAse (exonuclease V) alpha subunit